MSLWFVSALLMYGAMRYCHEMYALYLLQCTNLGQFATAFTRLPAIYESALTQHQTRMHTSSQADIYNNLYICACAAATHGNSAQLGQTCRTEHQRRLACQIKQQIVLRLLHNILVCA